jgi:hypothetical protein
VLGRPLNVVTAVVDALPAPEVNGTEGLAYLYRQVPHNEYELWTRGKKETDTMGSNNKNARSAASLGELSFVFDGLATANVAPDWLPQNVTNERTYTIALPLAQTLFSTGRATTMQLTCFTPAADNDHGLRLVHQEELHSAGLTLPFKHVEYNETVALEVSAHFPLTPLTPPRRINDCLGNVIRAISSFPTYGPYRYKHSKHSGQPKDQTASQELEEAISAYFLKQNIAPEPVEVYALIIPFEGPDFALRDVIKERYKSARYLIQFDREFTKGLAPLTVDQGIRDLIVKGHARLCKVLSGGGGWGEKKGLLSLDPDSYAPPVPAIGSKTTKFGKEHEGLDWPKDELAMGMEGLKAVVEVGESVMFFLASSKSRALPTRPADSRFGAVGGERRASESWKTTVTPSEKWRKDNHTVFGIVPSVMDVLPSSALVSSDTSPKAVDHHTAEEFNVQHIPHLFGALSASPLSLTTTTTEADLNDLRKRGKPSDYVHSQTKLGVAGLRVVVERSGTGVKQKFFRAKASPTGVVGSDWYAGAGHEPTQKLHLGRQREEREEAYESQRDAKTLDETEELRRDVEWIERQKRQIEDVTQVEGMFERMSDAEAAEYARETEQNETKKGEQSQARDDSAADKTAASASEQALAALKKRPTASGQQTPTRTGEREK